MAERGDVRGGSRLWRRMYRLVRATTGHRLSKRIRYLDMSAFGGVFEARSDAARRLIPSPFELVEDGGRTSVTVLALDYRIVDHLSPHQELVVSLPVRHRKRDETSGSLPILMAVTTEEARWTYAELHGFPAIVGNVREERALDTRVARLSVEGRHALTLAVHEEPIAPSEERMVLLGNRDDRRVVATTFRIHGEAARSDVPGVAALELSDHPLVEPLRRIELASESRSSLFFPYAMASSSKARVIGRVPRAHPFSHRAPQPTPA